MTTSRTVPSDLTPGALEIPDLLLPEYVLANARSLGTKTALVEADSGRQISYAGLADAVSAAAAWLVSAGVRRGDVVALCAPDSIEFVVTFHAALSAGATVTPVNHVLADEEIIAHLQRAGARWLVTTADLFAGKLASAVGQVPGLAATFALGAGADPVAAGPGPAARRFAVLGLGAAQALWRSTWVAPGGVSPDDVACLPTSSGTTGRPKTVMLTHRSLVTNLCQIATAQRVDDSDVSLSAAPMFGIYGIQASVNAALVRGATIVIMPAFDLAAFLRAIQDYRVTRVEIVPPVALLLAQSDLVDDFDLSSLRLLLSAAAPLSPDVARACARRLGVRVYQAYGMTEAAGGTHHGLDAGPDHPDSVGPALPGVECRIVDLDTGADVAADEPGELLIRTPSLMSGYLNDPDATAAAVDADGWYHTGDVVTVDADGWYRVTDRIKELIKTNGLSVAPAQIEDILLTHPSVADVAVVRSPDESAGEVPKAFVVRKPGVAPASAPELITWVATRLAPYKWVRRVEFTDSIPKNATGKILRRELAEREYQAQRQSQA
jgi:acyl-CoA synthetase (AMP-forming)/AMP-acid ligase II